jgi:hypothetical protein
MVQKQWQNEVISIGVCESHQQVFSFTCYAQCMCVITAVKINLLFYLQLSPIFLVIW